LTERELSRKANWRLAIIRHAQEVTGNVAFTCRYYGVPRQSFPHIADRRGYDRLTQEGLELLWCSRRDSNPEPCG
jgi:hypothetical protein